MKNRNPIRKPYSGAIALITMCFCSASLQADLINQTVSQGSANAAGWNAAVWGTPAAAPVPGNDYLIPSGTTLRTPNYATNMAFPGDTLISTNGGTLAMKHSAGVASANFILGPSSLGHFGGSGSTGVAPSPIGGNLLAAGSITYNASGTTTPQPRHLTLLATMTGAGDFNIGNCYTSVVYLANNGVGYSGNWNNTGGRLVILGGTAPLGSGIVNLANDTNTLTLNATNDMVLTNQVMGFGGVIKANTNTVLMPGSYAFTGGLTSQNGTLVLTGTGAQTSTVVDDNGILLVANAASIPFGSTLRVVCNNPDTGRLELSNNVTLSIGTPIELSMRNTNYPALVSSSGNNVVHDPIAIQSGGGYVGIQVDAGATLDLVGGVSSLATSGRNFTLLGDGNGTVTGPVDNGSASSLALNKTGNGTWTLNNFNTYSGATLVSGGTLRLGASSSIAFSSAIGVENTGKLDASQIPGGLPLNFNQVLRGTGAVIGDVTTSAGSLIEVGFYNQYGQLSLSNNLVLNGGETNRFEIGGSNDVLNVAGTITLNGNTTILVAAPEAWIENGTYRLVNYSGTLQGAGSLTLVAPPTRQTFTLVTSTPGQINLAISGNPLTLTWSGDHTANLWDIGASMNWNAQTEMFFNGDDVVFTDAGSANPDIEVVAPVSVGSMLVNNSAKAYAFTNSPISSYGNLTKKGTEALVLANDCNFRGLITVEAGTLSIGNGGATGALGTGAITNNGEILVNRFSGGVTLQGEISGAGTIRVTGGETNFNLTVRGTNTYTGLTTIETNCALTVQNNSALGNPVAGTKVLAGGRLGITTMGPWSIAEPIEINGDGLVGFPGALYLNTISNLATFAGPITVGSAARIRVVNNYAQLVLNNTVIGNQTPLMLSSEGTGTQIIFNNTLSLGNEAVLTKNGSGAAILAGQSNLCGSTVIDAGSLVIAATNAPAIGDVTVNAGILQIGDGGPNGSFPTGLINLAGSGSSLRFDSSNQITLNREIFGAGGMAKYNSNTVVILSSNSFAGNVLSGSGSPSPNGRGAGIIELRHQYGLGDGLAYKTVQLLRAELQLTGGLTLPGAISYEISGGRFVNSEGAGLIPIRNTAGNNVIDGSIFLIGGAGNAEIAADGGSLTLNGSITANATGRVLLLSGTGNGIINGTLYNNGANLPALTKQGSGTWTLNSYNDYSGATVIEGGTLVLGASAMLAGTPSITLLSNAVLKVTAMPGGLALGSQTLRGNGTVQGDVATAGIVSPGTSVGTLNITGSIFLGSETVMELNRAGTPNGDLLAAASITMGGVLTITNIGPDLQPGDTFNLFDGTLSGMFFATNLPALTSPDYFWDFTQFATQGIIKVGSTTAAPPTILPPAIVGTNIVLTLNSVAGFTYHLEASPAVLPVDWQIIESKPGGGVLTFTIPINPAGAPRFFHINVE